MVINLLNYITMKKIFALLIVATTLFSCSKTEDVIFDGNRSITYFQVASFSLPVDVNEGGTQTRSIVSSTLSNVDRSVEIELISSTLQDADSVPVINFTFTETVIIPAGEYSGDFTVSAEPVEELTTSNELILFRIASSSDGADLNGNLQQLEVQMRLSCPVPDDRYEDSNWLANTVACTGDGAGGCEQTGLVYNDYPVSIEPGDEAGEFILSDITGGLYAVGYGSSDNAVTVEELCNELVVSDQPDTVYGGDVFNGTGFITLDANGDLEEFFLEWSNGFGDAGETTFVRAN